MNYAARFFSGRRGRIPKYILIDIERKKKKKEEG